MSEYDQLRQEAEQLKNHIRVMDLLKSCSMHFNSVQISDFFLGFRKREKHARTPRCNRPQPTLKLLVVFNFAVERLFGAILPKFTQCIGALIPGIVEYVVQSSLLWDSIRFVNSIISANILLIIVQLIS